MKLTLRTTLVNATFTSSLKKIDYNCPPSEIFSHTLTHGFGNIPSWDAWSKAHLMPWKYRGLILCLQDSLPFFVLGSAMHFSTSFIRLGSMMIHLQQDHNHACMSHYQFLQCHQNERRYVDRSISLGLCIMNASWLSNTNHSDRFSQMRYIINLILWVKQINNPSFIKVNYLVSYVPILSIWMHTVDKPSLPSVRLTTKSRKCSLCKSSTVSFRISLCFPL